MTEVRPRTALIGRLRPLSPLLLLPLLLAAAPSGDQLARFEFREICMGTEFHLVLYTGNEAKAQEAARAVFERAERLEQVFSDYREESELELAEPVAAERPKVVSPELYAIIDRSLQLARLTHGAFDITVKPVVDLWRAARRSGSLPAAAELRAALGKVGHDRVLLNPRSHSVHLTVPGMRLDFGGIGKGWAADEAKRVLNDRGISRFLVDAGGDLLLGSPPPGKRGWRVAIQDDAADPSTIQLADCAIATSGDFYQFIEVNGERYSHIVDPSTGIGVRHSGTVTVIAPDGATADALATAFSVMESEAVSKLIRKLTGVEVRISRLSRSGRTVLYRSPGFPS